MKGIRTAELRKIRSDSIRLFGAVIWNTVDLGKDIQELGSGSLTHTSPGDRRVALKWTLNNTKFSTLVHVEYMYVRGKHITLQNR